MIKINLEKRELIKAKFLIKLIREYLCSLKVQRVIQEKVKLLLVLTKAGTLK